MIVVFWVTALCSDTKKQCLGLVSKDPGVHPTYRFQNVIFNASQWKKATAHTKAFHKILTNVKQYLKNIKEDAQIFSACTGSAW